MHTLDTSEQERSGMGVHGVVSSFIVKVFAFTSMEMDALPIKCISSKVQFSTAIA